MLNFTYENTTRIHFGEGQIQALEKEIPKTAKVLMIYGGGSIHHNGVYDQVKDALKTHTVYEFSGVEPNPTYDTLMKAQSLIRDHQIDYLLAVGGGSVVDGTKFIAAAACYEDEDPWDIVKNNAIVHAALPIGAVLTLPATGTESNVVSVVTRGESKLSFASAHVRPQFAVLDPKVTLSLSERQISNGVVDAFIHVIEQYLTYPVNAKVQDRFAEGLMQTLIEEGPKVLDPVSKDDLVVRSNIMWSATQALSGLIGVGVPQDWTTHLIGHELTAAHGIDHARTLSIVLPAVMKVCREAKREKLLQYAARVWDIQEGDEDTRINHAIQKTELFFQNMRVPVRLSDVGLGEQAIDPMLQKLESHGMTALGEKGEFDLAVCRNILQEAL
ncbi:iron-containing alcohol dehydrogenase [Algicola sagamiensis]|uniref:iron-containing alcohol dehydrogenase n=1 Tax=Algicola sagamiensis TaxID=163869 RepID=UPI0003725C15|nr:iron-containing alcohol dehydrogenase [Algicola sagamiensis]